jgi:hypothetical protein
MGEEVPDVFRKRAPVRASEKGAHLIRGIVVFSSRCFFFFIFFWPFNHNSPNGVTEQGQTAAAFENNNGKIRKVKMMG